MKIDILTLFPDMFAPLEHSILGKAKDKGLLEINYHNFRENAEKARHPFFMFWHGRKGRFFML